MAEAGHFPEAVPQGNFQPVEQKDDEPTVITFDLETTGLISDVMPHITQIGVTNVQTGDKLSIYVNPGLPISTEAQTITGISVIDTTMYVRGRPVKSVSIKSALNDLVSWLQRFKNVCLVAHNGRYFDFPVLNHALVNNDMIDQFLKCITSCVDSLDAFRKEDPNKKSFKLEYLVKTVLRKTYDAHNAMADVENLGSLLLHYNLCNKRILVFRVSPTVVFKKSH